LRKDCLPPISPVVHKFMWPFERFSVNLRTLMDLTTSPLQHLQDRVVVVCEEPIAVEREL
jgi:hypothetical protein